MADVRVTDLPAASSLANGDVLHGVQAADSQDKQFSLTDLSTFFAGGAPISSVFGRTGAIVATNGDYDIGELGDVDLSVAPTSGQFLKWDGSNWIADNTPAVVVDLAYSSTASNGTVTNTAGTNATIPGATTLSAGLFSATDKVKLNGIATGAQVNVPADLGYTTAASTGTVTSSTGTDATIPAATTSLAGLLTSADKTKLDGIAAGAQVNVATNLGYTTAASTGTVTSSTGTNATLPAATTSLAGLLTGADKTKLDGIQAGAQVNVATNLSNTPAASTVSVNSSTGTNTTLPAATASAAGVMTSADKSKLDGIAAGAEVNVNADWNATSGDALILNKPTIPSGVTNLSYTTAASTGTVNSSTGTNATIPAATTSVAGLLTSSDKSKLDGIAAGAQVNVATNLSNTPAASTLDVNSSTGNNTTLPAATTSAAGVMTSADKSKLNGIAAGAQVNVATNLGYTTAASSGTVTSSTGTNATIPAATTSLAGLLTSADKTKLDGIATGATANTGTVTSVSGGTGLTGTVTTSGSISLANTAVTPGSYTLANITIDQQGRITAASSGSAGGTGTVTSIATSAPITGGTITTSGTIGISAATTTAAGSMSAADKSKLDGISAGARTGTVTSVATSGALTGGTITTSGTLSVRNASTAQTGVVQLADVTNSTSTTQAGTANAVRSAYDRGTQGVNAASTAQSTANAALARTGGTMTGGVYQTVRTISNNSTWNMATGNLWHFAGGTIANPSNATAGMSGLIRVAAAISGWGTNFDFPGGTAVAPAAFPALIPYYVSGTNVIMIGTPIEGIT